MELVWDNIVRVLPNGLLLSKGETVPLDVLIFATGFHAGAMQLDVVGENSVSLSEYFASQGGPTAYLGTTYPGFPNFFTLMGPNIATGHASIIFSEECQIDYSLQLIAPILQRKVKSVNVKADVCSKFNDQIQKQLKDTVWEACTNWYHERDGGKNIALWPGPLVKYWWKTRVANWEDYEVRGTQAWEKEVRRKKVKRAILILLTIIAIVASAHPVSRKIVEVVLKGVATRLLSIIHSLPL